MYCVAITTLSYHFLFTRSVFLVAWSLRAAISFCKVEMERMNKFGMLPFNCPSIHHATSPSFLPMVLTRTMIS